MLGHHEERIRHDLHEVVRHGSEVSVAVPEAAAVLDFDVVRNLRHVRSRLRKLLGMIHGEVLACSLGPVEDLQAHRDEACCTIEALVADALRRQQ